jgi:hypothetical protein
LSFIGFTDIVDSFDAKNNVGISQIFIVSLFIATNLVVFIFQIFQKIKGLKIRRAKIYQLNKENPSNNAQIKPIG